MDETVLRQLAQEMGLLLYPEFRRAFQKESKRLGYNYRDPVSPRTWRRWLSGDVQTRPQPQARDVLEHMFSRPIAELFAPAPSTTDGQCKAPLPPARMFGAAVEQPRGMYEMMMDAASQSREAAAEAELELGQVAMETVEEEVVRLARTYLLRPPMEAFPDLVGKRDQVRAMRDGTRRSARRLAVGGQDEDRRRGNARHRLQRGRVERRPARVSGDSPPASC
jgi:hypothetical protein